MHRVLLIAEAANPEWVSVPLVGWSHALALSRVADVHLVTQVRNRDAILRFGWCEDKEFTAIDSELVSRFFWRASQLLRGGTNRGWTMVTALKGPAYLHFESLFWKRFSEDLKRGKYDLVHRITPLSPTTPTLLPRLLRRIGVPHVVGPLNGGVPWPDGFDSARHAEKEWLSYVRGAYRLGPGQRSLRKHAAAILCGSSDTYGEYAGSSSDRLIYMPENAVDPERFPAPRPGGDRNDETGPLRIAFVGRLVPYKGVDMLLEAASELVRAGKAVLDIMGDGPEREALEGQARSLGLEAGVTFAGWIKHEDLHARLGCASVLGFPSIREFGGGVVLEAMALGLVPVVAAYGGPKELVTASTGISLPIGTRSEMVKRLRAALTTLSEDRALVQRLGSAARNRVLQHFTWARKAEHTLQVYDWVLGRAPKPDRGMPFPDGPGQE